MCEEMIKNPYRRVWACVNLDALHDNLRQIAACRKNDAGIIAVIKADGYGHGAVMLAREMDEIPEVIRLRSGNGGRGSTAGRCRNQKARDGARLYLSGGL